MGSVRGEKKIMDKMSLYSETQTQGKTVANTRLQGKAEMSSKCQLGQRRKLRGWKELFTEAEEESSTATQLEAFLSVLMDYQNLLSEVAI